MTNPFPSDTQLQVLGLLRDAPAGMYGLEIVEASNGRVKRGTIYVILGRLEEKGFVEARTKRTPGQPGLPRPVYRITGLGYKVLEAGELLGLQPAGA
jgi:PadR family transcriptional regulator, regulatory protein PadR